MSTTSRLPVASFALSLGGLIAAITLFALIYFQCLPNTSYLWVAITVLACQLPALAMSLSVRSHPLGRAALALSSSILVGMLIGILFLTPTSVSQSSADTIESAQEVLGQIHLRDEDSTTERTIAHPYARRCAKPIQRNSGGYVTHA